MPYDEIKDIVAGIAVGMRDDGRLTPLQGTHLKGYEAFLRGTPREAPYTRSVFTSHWEAGWDEAKADQLLLNKEDMQ